MNPFMFEALRRRLNEHQGRPPRSNVPMWRLLWGELKYLLGWLLDRARLIVWLPALLVAAAVMIGLDERTPGPVLATWERLATASVAAAVVAVAGRAMRSGISRSE